MIESISLKERLKLYTGLSAEEIESMAPNSHKIITWACENNHKWLAPVSRINGGAWCGYCDGQFAIVGVNDLETTHPEIAQEHVEEDRKLITLMAGSNYLALWRCIICSGSYRMAVQKAVRAKSRCPYCHMRKLLTGFNDLETLYPKLSLELSSSNMMKSSEILANKSRVLVWFCKKCNRDYERPIGRRIVSDRGCPTCKGQELIAGYTDLKSYSETLANELIDLSPSEIHRFSNKVVDWSCSVCSHVWRTSVVKRSKRGDGCRNCSSSAPEKDFSLFLNSLDLKFSTHDRALIHPLEIDFLIEDLALAIEFNGDYWHSNEIISANSRFKNAYDYHDNKFNKCAEGAVKLAYVWESDWHNNRRAVEDSIKIFIKTGELLPLLSKFSNSSVR